MGLLKDSVKPYARTGGYYAKSWRRYLSGDYDGDLPVVRPTVALATQAFLDEVVLVGFRFLRQEIDPQSLRRIADEVTQAHTLYEQKGWLVDPERFLTTPPTPTDVTIRRVTSGKTSYERLSFTSGYEPHTDEPGRDRWLSYVGNKQAYATMLRHKEPRPWLVAVHGAEMGRGGFDHAIFRARHLHEQLGLNVILPVLPLHGPRRRGVSKGTGFPGEDVLDNVHAAAQSTWDVRSILAWIRSQQPDARIGMTSISLGGYVTALVASLDEQLTCAILGVPAVDIVDLLDRHAGPAPSPAQREALDLARQVARVVSPLAMTPKVPFEGRFIFAGLADRLVHPRDQVARIWEHWGRNEIEWYPGGHTGFFRSRPVQDFVEQALTQSGLVDPEQRKG